MNMYTNHFSPDVKEVFELMRFVGEIAVGSYGMIYLHDDENNDGKRNLFQVYTLAKGKIAEYIDEFLSPLTPKVEDAYEIDEV